MVEYTIDGNNYVYVDYEGNLVVKYTEYGMYSSQTVEIDVDFDDLVKFVEIAKIQRDKYNKHEGRIKRGKDDDWKLL